MCFNRSREILISCSHAKSILASVTHICCSSLGCVCVCVCVWLHHGHLELSQPGTEPVPPAVEMQSLNPRTIRDVHVFIVEKTALELCLGVTYSKKLFLNYQSS